MRRRVLAILFAFILLGAVMLAKPSPTYAIQAWIAKVKSDCTAIQASITLTYNRDDGGGKDWFVLEVFHKDPPEYMTHIAEGITQADSPYYWQTDRIPTSGTRGAYRLDVTDLGANGVKIRRVDQAYHDCIHGVSWRPENASEPNPELPKIPDCYTWVPIYSTNLAPESGAVLVMWSFDPDREDNPSYVEYHVATLPVEKEQGLDHVWVRAPCGVYIKVYYQPDSTKNLYFMPSQYFPHGHYGTANYDTDNVPYHTFFPLDGPARPPEDGDED